MEDVIFLQGKKKNARCHDQVHSYDFAMLYTHNLCKSTAGFPFVAILIYFIYRL